MPENDSNLTNFGAQKDEELIELWANIQELEEKYNDLFNQVQTLTDCLVNLKLAMVKTVEILQEDSDESSD
jgi:peptidoglycan hydrolase CwlO-like protein